MKHDPLKRFIEENKEAFDEFLPAPDVLPGVQAALERRVMENHNKGLKLRKFAVMWRIAGAAALVLACGLTWIYLLPGGKKADPIPDFSFVEIVEKEAGHSAGSDLTGTGSETLHGFEISPATEVQPVYETQPVADPKLNDVMVLLNDSLSGSARLKGVLMLAGLPVLDAGQIRVLEEKLATDPSLHVRMAALDLLNRHSPAEEVADRIVYNLSKQEDPIMQLSLMNAAVGLVETQLPVDTFRHCLNELVQNPATLAMVKDEAAAFLFTYQGMKIYTNQ